METEPTDEELRAFIGAMLSNVDRGIREPEVVDETLHHRRDMWVMLYRAHRASLGADAPDPQS